MKAYRTIGIAALLAASAAAPAYGQTAAAPAHPSIRAAMMASGYAQQMISTAANQMSEEDYAYRPTAEVRSFGEILGHVADVNYMFCAAAAGSAAPAKGIEKSVTTRAGLQQALTESFAYCNGVYGGLTTESALASRELMGQPMEALTVLLFRSHHLTLHYGNIITYMRLLGRVPPSSQNSPVE